MFRSVFAGVLLVLALNLGLAFGADYKLTNGDVYRGEAVSFSDDGIVVSLEIGGFSPRVPWGKLTQETLKALSEVPEAKEYVEPYIEVPPDVKELEKKKRREIRVSEPPTKVPHVESRTGFFAAMANPLGFALLGALYLANLYAGMEVARFRGRPVPLVVGISAIAPIIGPALFTLLPPGRHGQAEPPPPPDMAPADAVNPMQQALPSTMGGSGLSVASTGGGKAAANPAYTMVHNRNNATIDRRFFETKFAGFFRVVPADAEKDLVLVVKTPKKEIVATRVSRISATEVHLQTQQGAETSVTLGEITEVSVRPKGAK